MTLRSDDVGAKRRCVRITPAAQALISFVVCVGRMLVGRPTLSAKVNPRTDDELNFLIRRCQACRCTRRGEQSLECATVALSNKLQNMRSFGHWCCRRRTSAGVQTPERSSTAPNGRVTDNATVRRHGRKTMTTATAAAAAAATIETRATAEPRNSPTPGRNWSPATAAWLRPYLDDSRGAREARHPRRRAAEHPAQLLAPPSPTTGVAGPRPRRTALVIIPHLCNGVPRLAGRI